MRAARLWMIAGVLVVTACGPDGPSDSSGTGSRIEAGPSSSADAPAPATREADPSRAAGVRSLPPVAVQDAPPDVSGYGSRRLLATYLLDDREHRAAARERIVRSVTPSGAEVDLFAAQLEHLDGPMAEVLVRAGPAAIASVVRAAADRPEARANANVVLRRLATEGHGAAVAAALRELDVPGDVRPFAMDLLATCGSEGVRELTAWIARDGADGRQVLHWVGELGPESLPLVRAHVDRNAGRLGWPERLAITSLGDAGREFRPLLEALPPGPTSVQPGRLHRILREGRERGTIDKMALAVWSHLDTCSCGQFAVGCEIDELERVTEDARSTLLDVLADRKCSKMWRNVATVLARAGHAEEVVRVLRDDLRANGPSGDGVLAIALAGDPGARLFRERVPAWLASDQDEVRRAAVHARALLDGPTTPTVTYLAHTACGDDEARATGAMDALWELRKDAAAAAPILGEAIRSGAVRCRVNRAAEHSPEVRRVESLFRALAAIGRPAHGQSEIVASLVEDDLFDSAAMSALVDIGGGDDEIAWRWLRRHPFPGRALEMLARGEGPMAPELEKRVWDLWLNGEDRYGLASEALERRGAFSAGAVDRLLSSLAREPGSIEKRAALVLADPDVAHAFDVLQRLEAAGPAVVDSLLVLNEDVAFPARLVGVLHPMLAHAATESAAIQVMAALGQPAVGPFLEHTATRATDRASLERQYLLAVRALSTRRPDARWGAVCRLWLETRYGPLETRTGLPRDIPDKRSDLLRWAIYEATVAEDTR